MTIRPNRFLLLLAAVLTTGALPLPAQQTWIVDVRNGPGSHFTAVQAAFDDGRVRPGDTIYIRDGIYRPTTNPFAVATLRKALLVRGEWDVRFTHELIVEGIPAGQNAAVSHIGLDGLTVRSCPGQVTFEEISSEPFSNSWRISGCASVQFTGATQWYGGLRITDSVVGLHRCDFRGLTAATPEAYAAVVATSSSLSICDTLLYGGVLYRLGVNLEVPPLELYRSNAGICGSSVVGDPRYPPLRGVGAGNGRIVADPAVVFHAPYREYGITVETRPIPALHLDETRIGASAAGTVTSSAAGAYAVLVSGARVPMFVPALQGALSIDPALYVVVAQGVLPAGGSAAWSLTVPPLGPLKGQVVAAQPLVAGPEPVLGNAVYRPLYW